MDNSRVSINNVVSELFKINRCQKYRPFDIENIERWPRSRKPKALGKYKPLQEGPTY